MYVFSSTVLKVYFHPVQDKVNLEAIQTNIKTIKDCTGKFCNEKTKISFFNLEKES